MIDAQTINQIKGNQGVPDVLMSYLPAGGLKREGNSFRGVVPWRGDDHASLTLSLKDGSWLWNDITQGGGGDIFQLVQNWHGLKFPAAVEWWATRLGITVKHLDDGRKNSLAPTAERVSILRRVYEKAEPLTDGTPCAEYLRRRGLLDVAKAMPVKCYNPEHVERVEQAASKLNAGGVGTLARWAKQGEGFLVYGSKVGDGLIVHRARLLHSHEEARGMGFHSSHLNVERPDGLSLPALWPTMGELPKGGTIALTEGESDAMAVRALVPGLDTYAILGSAMFHPSCREFKEIISSGSKVVLAMQTDAASRKCCNRLVADLEAAGVEVSALVPSGGVKDWADALSLGQEPKESITDIGVPLSDDSLSRAFGDLRKHASLLQNGKIKYVPLRGHWMNWSLGGSGLPPRSLGLLAARTGAGKSWLAMNAAVFAAEKLIPTYYINTELHLEAVAARLLGLKARSSTVSAMVDYEQLNEAMKKFQPELDRIPLEITAPEPRSLDDVLELLAEKARAKVPLLIVDHIGDLDSGATPPYEALPRFAREARGIAHSAGSSILLVTHLRAGEKDDVMAFSRQIENVVDYSWSLVRHEEAMADVENSCGNSQLLVNLILTVRKSRYGASDLKIGMRLDAETLELKEQGRFKQWSKSGGYIDDDTAASMPWEKERED